MDLTTFLRVWKTGFTNFWRNKWLSLAATSVMVITLVIISVLSGLFSLTAYSVNAIKDRVDISVYLNPGVPEAKIDLLKKELEANPKISAITYVSASQALENFKAIHAQDQMILDSLAELTDNPLPATIQVKALNIADYPQISDEINKSPNRDIISKVNFEDNRVLIDRLGRILDLIIRFGVVLAIIFSAIAVLVIFNTITLTIYNRREEVEIMRLVGATNWYIRGPFLVEAILYSISATVVTTAFTAYILQKILPQVSLLVGSQEIASSGWLNLGFISLVLFILAVVLSIFSSTLAIRKYLRI